MYNRWLIAFACAWINIFIFSIFRSAGVIYLELIHRFNCTYQQAAWSLSLIGSVASITGMFSGFLTHYIPIRSIILFGIGLCSFSVMSVYFATSIEYVTITIGFCQGIGIGLITNLLPVVLNAYFKDNKSMAFGISYAGATLGAFIFPVVIKYMFEVYQFNEAMILMGALILNAAAGGLLLPWPNKKRTNIEPSPAIQMVHLEPLIDECNTIVYLENNRQYSNIISTQQKLIINHEEEKEKLSFCSQLASNITNDAKIIYNRYFFLCTMSYTCFILQFVAFIIILPDVARDQHIQESDSRWLLSIFSITDFIGRLLPGWLSYLKLISDKNTYILSLTIMSLSMAFLLVLDSWLHFVVLTLVCGLMTGCQMVLSPAVLSDYMGHENIAVAFGMCNFICGIITLFTRPFIIGVKDSYGNYEILSYILLAYGLSCSFLWILELLKNIFS